MRFAEFDKYFSVMKIELIDFFQSKWDVIFGFLFLGVIIFVYSQLWGLGFAQKSIQGYDLGKIVFYVAVAESVWISTRRVYKTIDKDIKQGFIANYLSKPVDYVLFRLSNSLGKSIITFLINLALCLILLFALFGSLPIGLGALLATVIVSFIAIILLLSVSIAFGLLGFWTEDAEAFQFLYSKAVFIFGGLVFPIDLYPAWLKAVADFLPFKWGVFASGKIAVSFNIQFFLEVVSMQAFWIVLSLAACFLLFSRIRKSIFVNGG